MKRTLTAILVTAIAVIMCACGGPDKDYNKQYNIKDGHPQTKQAIELVKSQQLESSMPGYKILKYTDLADLVTEDTKIHYMHLVIKHNGNTEDYCYYFNWDVTDCSKKLEYILHPELYGF